MKKMLRLVSATASVLAIGLGGIPIAANATSFEVPSTTTLHPGDKVSLTILNHPELLVPTTTIDGSGRVAVPLIGLVRVENLTPTQADQKIASRLAVYVRQPAVDLALVSQGLNIFVTGGPGGAYPYIPGETLSTALAQVRQGTTATNQPAIVPTLSTLGQTSAVNGNGSAETPTGSNGSAFGSVDLRRVVIERDGRNSDPIDAERLVASGSAGPSLQPGDTIVLPDKPIPVAVTGEVVNPTTAHLSPDEPLSAALRQAGGSSGTAAQPESAIGFELTRGNSLRYVTASSAEYRQPAQPGDKIYVPHARRVGVVGMVGKPGDVILAGDHSLVSALYFAGGPTKWANLKYVSVVHAGEKQTYDVTQLTHGTMTQNPELADGDTVFVPEGHKIDFSTVFPAIYALGQLRGL